MRRLIVAAALLSGCAATVDEVPVLEPERVPAAPAAQTLSERELFVRKLRGMSDRELSGFMKKRSDAVTENARLTGEVVYPKWHGEVLAEAANREKERMLWGSELRSLSKAELDERILATEGKLFQARLLRQLERARGKARDVIKFERSTEARRLEGIRTGGYSPEVVERLRAREVWVGMTEQQLRLSRGEPESVKPAITAVGKSTQWTYPEGCKVYVGNGVVAAVQY